MEKKRPIILCVLDGWGHRPDTPHNSIALASTPVWDGLIKAYPHNTLQASEGFVGLPRGQMGNSEVGHTNLGAGRVVNQDLPRIDSAIETGTLATNPNLQNFIRNLKKSGGTCHLMGLLSPGGVHAHHHHVLALIPILTDAGIPVRVHGFLDGRDTPPRSAETYIIEMQKALPDICWGTIGGRYYGMDRDKRWDRVALSYTAMVEGVGPVVRTPLDLIKESYAKGLDDEFIIPSVIEGYGGMQDGDGILMINFRADRARQILGALLDSDFKGFVRSKTINFISALGMGEYSSHLNKKMGTIFPKEALEDVLGKVISEAGLRQLRVAETEKYAHVTFFFNGGQELPFAGEERLLIPSPQVATYDLCPEMSAFLLTDQLIEVIEKKTFDFIVVNYANTDMVGHTGDEKAAIKAVETVDTCLGRLREAIEKVGGSMIITADHGNAETMWDTEISCPHTAHTCNPVPIILVAPPASVIGLESGSLCDVAPTILALLNLPKPRSMTGRSLLITG